MKTSLKSFAALVVTIGISGMGAANPALAGGPGAHGGSRHVSGGRPSHSPVNRGSHPSDRRDSRKFDHDRDRYRDYGRYNFWRSPWSYRSSYCYPFCCTPGYCRESIPQYCAPEPCGECCPSSPPICEQETCFPSCPEYCDSYGFPGWFGRKWWDKSCDRYKDRDYRKDRDEFKGRPDRSKLSHGNHNGKGHLSGPTRGSSAIGRMGTTASHAGGMSGGSHGGHR
jgi:hypothetical protein